MSKLNTILALFGVAGPAAIAPLVIPIIVDAFQCQPFGWLPHILQEVRADFPPLANLDAASTVSGVVLVLGVRAALKHLRPHVPSARVALPVGRGSDAGQLGAQASATVNVATSQCIDTSVCSAPAVASEFPHDASALPSFCSSLRYQATESLACNVMADSALALAS